MAIFPNDIDLSTVIVDTVDETLDSSAIDKVGRSFEFDFKQERFILNDGIVKEPSEVKAIQQWIELFIRTEILKYKVYDENFGIKLNDLIGYRLPRGYQVAEIIRRVTEGIIQNCPKVKEVKDWNFDNGLFSFVVVLDDGKEVIING